MSIDGNRISAIAAMTASGMLAVELKTGSVNGDDFFDYVRGSLIPEMLPFDGRNPKSIALSPGQLFDPPCSSSNTAIQRFWDTNTIPPSIQPRSHANRENLQLH